LNYIQKYLPLVTLARETWLNFPNLKFKRSRTGAFFPGAAARSPPLPLLGALPILSALPVSRLLRARGLRPISANAPSMMPAPSPVIQKLHKKRLAT